jgi:hypothetical protein
VAELSFGPQADDLLTELEADPVRVRLLEALNSALDRLEQDPGDVWCRRRRYQNLGVWGIAVPVSGDLWLVLWEDGPGDSVIVHSITPAP